MPLRCRGTLTRSFHGIVDPRRCNCSLCRRKGAVMAPVPLSGIRVVKGEEVLKLYQFNTMSAEHYFCLNCGIYTHHQRQSMPDGYNVGCLEGVNPFDLGEVRTGESINHPEDRAPLRSISYRLRFLCPIFRTLRCSRDTVVSKLKTYIRYSIGFGVLLN